MKWMANRMQKKVVRNNNSQNGRTVVKAAAAATLAAAAAGREAIKRGVVKLNLKTDYYCVEKKGWILFFLFFLLLKYFRILNAQNTNKNIMNQLNAFGWPGICFKVVLPYNFVFTASFLVFFFCFVKQNGKTIHIKLSWFYSRKIWLFI